MTAAARFLSILAIALLGVAVVLAVGDRAPPVATPTASAAEGLSFTPLPALDGAGGSALLARSPFAEDRSAYVRRSSEAAVMERPVEIRLVAVFAAGGAPRATLLVDGAELTVGLGDPTPAGAVAAIGPDAVILGAAGGRRVGFFE